LSQPIPLWGLKTSFQAYFNSIKIGDLLWFYSASPVSGVIGLGAVKDKYIDNENLIWPEEIENNKVIWPLRFRIQVLKVLPAYRWKEDNIKINDFGLFWQTSLHLLNDKHISELLNRAEKSFGNINLENIYAGASIAPAEKVSDNTDVYEEITEKEFELSHSNLIFEIELSGMLEKAIDRLLIAFKKWNSRPRIIIPDDYSNKLKNVINLKDKDFQNQLKIYKPVQIADLYNLKTSLKGLEQKLELY
jgi:hypothetical protein